MTISRSKIVNLRLFISGLGVALPALFLYWYTSYPSVAYIDSGELAVVNWTLGIAHPTGYPLYTLIGRLFALLPFELIKTQILFGALCTTAAVVLILYVMSRFLPRRQDGNPDGAVRTAGSQQAAPDFYQLLLFTTLGLLLVVSPLFWAQGVTNEVYSLHLVFLSLLILLILQPYSARNLILGGYLTGLSFGNHMSTILIVPTVVAYLIVNRRVVFRSPKMIVTAIAAGCFAASVYLFLPIRSALDPMFNWGQPANWENFIRHVSGWQYQVWMFDRSWSALGQQLVRFAKILFAQFPAPFWLAIAAGLYYGFKTRRTLSIYLLLLLLFNLIYSLNFSIPDIDNYLLPSVLVLFLFGAMGTLQFARLKPSFQFLAPVGIALCVVWGVAGNWGSHDESQNTSALDGVHNYYKSVENGALILCADWDFVSPWLYSHFYLKERTDVTIIDPELVRRSWYPDWIRHADKQLYDYVKSDIDAFLQHVRKFERQESYDPVAIEATYRAILLKLATHPQRPVYFGIPDAGIATQVAATGFAESYVSGQLLRIVRKGATFTRPTEPISPPRFGKTFENLDERDRAHLEDFGRMSELDTTGPIKMPRR
ncbi:hypothetical protein LDC_1459 [sediment metagenome]|uniref:DUF2723 domain-containing protein n=1 Tax=sediment metagenome TaxID=749907 RepID=D9PIV1_9ZZZZ